MYRYSDVTIRRFIESDIPLKVEWINDPRINQHLHFDVPISVEGTTKWFNAVKDRTDRIDMTICYNDIPVGICGLLNIDMKNLKAEFYCTIGDLSYHHKGIATKAMLLTYAYAFKTLGLNKVFSMIETENKPSIAMLMRCNCVIEGTLKEEVRRGDKFVDVNHISVFSKDFELAEGMYEE